MGVLSVIIFGSMSANDFLFSLIYHYIGYSTGGYGSGGVIGTSLAQLLFYEIPILLKNVLIQECAIYVCCNWKSYSIFEKEFIKNKKKSQVLYNMG